jgi:hypothetical protein
MSNSNDALQDPAERERRWRDAVTRLHAIATQWRSRGLTPSDLTAAGRVVDGVHSDDLPEWFLSEWEWAKRRHWYPHQTEDWRGPPSARQWAWLAWKLNQEPNDDQADGPLCQPYEPPHLPEGFDPVEAEWQALIGTLDKAGHRIRIDAYADMCDLIADLINDTGELATPAETVTTDEATAATDAPLKTAASSESFTHTQLAELAGCSEDTVARIRGEAGLPPGKRGLVRNYSSSEVGELVKAATKHSKWEKHAPVWRQLTAKTRSETSN